MRALVVIALGGCVVMRKSEPVTTPSRTIFTVGAHGGASMIDEPATDGATGPGGEIGAGASAAYRITPRWSAGLGFDFSLAGHDSPVEGRSADYWRVFLPTGIVRRELGRFAVSTWGGWYLGFRMLTEGDGTFRTSVSKVKMQGPSLGLTGLVRMKPTVGGASFEVGPYVQASWMVVTEEESRTSFDEDGMTVRSLSFGLVVQGVFGSPPIAGDQF
jgi:hypothetical protein